MSRRALAALLLLCAPPPSSSSSAPADAASGASTAASGDVCGTVYGAERPVAQPLAGVALLLDGGAARAWSSAASGGFCFRGLAPGVHLIEPVADSRRVPALVFPTFKVQVPDAAGAAAGDAPRALEFRHPGAARLPAALPLVVRPVAVAALHEERPAGSALAFLMNPQVLLMLAVGAMTLCLPMLTKNMDPEALKEMQEQQAAMGDPAQLLRGLMGGAPAPAPAAARERAALGDDAARPRPAADAPAAGAARRGARDK
jgi:hypothetical protein